MICIFDTLSGLQIFQLMKTDCYSRFLKSDMYRLYLMKESGVEAPVDSLDTCHYSVGNCVEKVLICGPHCQTSCTLRCCTSFCSFADY